MLLLTEEIKHANILVLDDDSVSLNLVKDILSGAGINQVQLLEDPETALSVYQEQEIDLLLLDLHIPGMDGFSVIQQLEQHYKKLPPPILVLTADHETAIKHRALAAGARDFVTKPFDSSELIYRVTNLLDMFFAQKHVFNYSYNLEKTVNLRTHDLLETQLEMVRRLGFAAEYRDTETAQHTIRVGEYARILGQALGIKGEELQNLHHAAPMHDLGKIGIPDAVLLKKGAFTAEERQKMETHTLIGGQILTGARSPLLQTAQKVALHHHERWDGSGYPHKLKGSQIPIEARIVSVADVFDALCIERPYKKPWPLEKALDFLRENSGSMFDPSVIQAFFDHLDAILEAKQSHVEEPLEIET